MSDKSNAERQFEKMTKTPVVRLVLMLGLPTTISMLVTSIYNLADTYFVSDLGNSASGAIGVVFALMAIIQAFGFTFGHGAGSNISRLLGARNIDKAREFASVSLIGGVFCGIVILTIGLTITDPFMRLLGSTETILPYARDYSRYILLAAPVMIASCVMNNILRYEGKAAYAMIGLVSGGVLNIFGDYLLIKVLDMGVSGAGIATACSQCVSAVLLAIPFITGKAQSRIGLKYIKTFWNTLWTIIPVGLPSMMRQGLNSVSTMILNNYAGIYGGDPGIAAMSIVTKIVGLIFCIGIGIGQGFQPVSSFNYGAKQYSRVKKAYLFTCLFGTVFLALLGAVAFVIPEPLIRIFRDDADVLEFGRLALKLQAVSLLFMPFTVCTNMLFQSIGKSGKAIFLSSMRSGLCLIPLLILLSNLFGALGVQSAQAVSDVVSCMFAVPMAFSFLKRLPPDGTDEVV